MIDEPWSLPSDWRWARFEEVAYVAAALTDPAGLPSLPHIAPNHIQAETGRLLPYATVAEDGVTSAKHLFGPGDILYSKIRPYLAKVALAPTAGLCSADMYPIRTHTDLHAPYLRWWMLSREFTRRAAGEQARTVLPKINKRSLYELPVPVPPLEEQQRIVDLLEDHLSRLDAGRAYAEASRDRLRLLEHAVLRRELQVCGEVPTYPVRALLRQPITNGRSVPSQDGGFPVLRLTAIKDDGIDLSERKAGAWTAEEARPFLVQEGDFLLARGNGSLRLVGRGALVGEVTLPVAYPDTVMRLRLDNDCADPRFVALLWRSPIVRKQIESMARTTAGIYKVNQGHLNDIQLPVPPLGEQRRIVDLVAEAGEGISRLVDVVDQALRRTTGLRRSLLEAAFSGRLNGRRSDPEVVEEMAEAAS